MAAITKRGSSWVAQIFKRGVRKQASFSTKTEAAAWATHTEAEIMAGKTGKTANKTLGDLLEKYRDEVSVRKKGERWETIRINRLLDDPLTDIKLSDLKTPDFAKWRDKRRQEVSDATVRRELSQISTAISTAIRDWHWLTHHPMKGMTMPPVSKARDRLISQDEIDRLCAALGYTPGQRPVGIGAHTAVAMLFAIETAMRAGEICALRWADIDLSHRVRDIAHSIMQDIRNEIASGGSPLVNKETGWIFSLAANDARKMGNNHRMKPGSSKSAAYVRQLIAIAVHGEEHADTHGHGADAVHRFYAPALIDGALHRVRITVLDFQDSRGRRNLHAINAVEIESALLGTLPATDDAVASVTLAQPTTGRAINIRQLLKGVKKEDGSMLLDTGGTRLSRATEPGPQSAPLRTAKAASLAQDTSLIDKVASAPFKLIGWNTIIEPRIDRIMNRLGEFVPETVKAGLISDYAIGEDYTDRKALMKAAEALRNRKAAGLVEMLAGLTRAESRVAYQWMQTSPNEATEQALLAQLPEESRETLQRLKKMISDLGKEAVQLGQLSQEAYSRNNMAYLHRTYAKHVLDTQGGPIRRMLRARALRIKGNQYKGRGIFDEVDMAHVGGDNTWMKLQNGRADKALVGQTMIRFERRDASSTVTEPLPGMPQKPLGKLRQVIYWPSNQPVPGKLSVGWLNAGTFEVRGVKGDKLVVWRDYTKEERERMGELDEVRYAVAQTMQLMAHDIEVGRFFNWVAKEYGRAAPEGKEATASESMIRTYAKDEWVQVPIGNIPGTQVRKYGALAGLYIPAPIWNDIRQTAGTRIEPFGAAHEKVLQFWKKSKTAWSPAVHMNNVIANFVIADWHDLRAVDLYEALSIWANSGKRVAKAKGWVGLDGSEAKRQQYEQIMHRFEDSGALGGMFLSNEALRDEIAKQLESIKSDLTGEQEAKDEMTRMAKVMHLVTMAGMVPVKGAKLYTGKMEDAYQFEDAIFRLAAFVKASRYGKTDIEAGKIARDAFLNYDINAPWVQAARHSFLPFISFFYRALPMAYHTVKSKPWKILKLFAFWYLVNLLGYMGSGGDEDDERKDLPKEKQGSVWGVVPKMVRMPWNKDDDEPVFLDIRRWVPVGDIADLEMGAGMLPPWATPSGPLLTLTEIMLMNKSMFTEKEIVKDTDTLGEKTEKRIDYAWKSMLPNVPVPNPLNLQTPIGEINPLDLKQGSGQTYAWAGIERSMLKKEGTIGEVRTTPAALVSAFGIKVSAYPKANMQDAQAIEFRGKRNEIMDEVKRINRNYGNLANPTPSETLRYERDIQRQHDKLQKLQEEDAE